MPFKIPPGDTEAIYLVKVTDDGRIAFCWLNSEATAPLTIIAVCHDGLDKELAALLDEGPSPHYDRAISDYDGRTQCQKCKLWDCICDAL